jgi:uncharacterized protein
MHIGILRITLRLPSRELKAKRTIVRSVVQRIRNRFNAAAAEIADLDEPSRATIAIACISNDASHAQSQLQTIANAIEDWRLDAEVIEIETELIPLND